MQTETPSPIKLSILIPTVDGREQQLQSLVMYIKKQCGGCKELYINANGLFIHGLSFISTPVEIFIAKDNKEMTIGGKRERLYWMASGKFSWQIDDDDWIPEQAIPRILEAIEIAPADCITFEEACTIDGVKSRSNFSMHYPGWAENKFGYDHVRTPFFKTPILTSICRQVPVPLVRFGEDHLWAQAIKPLLKSETHIPLPLYHYNHTSSPHNERYGIKE